MPLLIFGMQPPSCQEGVNGDHGMVKSRTAVQHKVSIARGEFQLEISALCCFISSVSSRLQFCSLLGISVDSFVTPYQACGFLSD